MKRKKLKREFSAGGVVFKKEKGKILWLLIQPKGTKRWQFPKGLIEEKESSQETAIREVKEESGVEAEIVGRVDSVQYFYQLEGERIFKNVKFFLMSYGGGRTTGHDHEVDKAEFFPYRQAYQKLSFENEKKILEKAKRLLKERERQPKLL